jgi:hypothetical protein
MVKTFFYMETEVSALMENEARITGDSFKATGSDVEILPPSES